MHGQRKDYQAGCRCGRCRRANADYQRALRMQICRGILPLGARINARATWRLIRQLFREGFSKAEIARRLGLRSATLQWHPQTVTVRSQQRLMALYRATVLEDPDQ